MSVRYSSRHTMVIRLIVVIFLVGLIWSSVVRSHAQTSRFERHFPTTSKPHLTVSNAASISITGWDKEEISVTAVSTSDNPKAEEIKTQSDKDKLDIECVTSEPGEYISLNLQVPTKSLVDLQTEGNKIEIREPNGQVVARIVKYSIEMSAPSEAKYDLAGIDNAMKYDLQPNGAVTTTAVANKSVGHGPPYIRIESAASARIVINDPTVEVQANVREETATTYDCGSKDSVAK